MKNFLPMALLLLISLYAGAQITSFKFNLKDGGSRNINFESFNRVTFGSDRFILYSSLNPSITPLEIKYDESHSVTVVYDGTSDGVNEVNNPKIEMKIDGDYIYVENDDITADFTIAVYNTAGELQKTAKGKCSISDFSSGMYIAVAYDGIVITTKRIIIK